MLETDPKQPITGDDDSTPEATMSVASAEKRFGKFTARISGLKEKNDALEQQMTQQKTEFDEALSNMTGVMETMNNSVKGIEDSVAVTNAPDPEENLPEYLKWQQEQSMKLIRSEVGKLNKPQVTTSQPKSPNLAQATDTDQINRLRAMQLKSEHDDFDEMTALALEDAKKDSSGFLPSQWQQSTDPVFSMYSYGKKVKAANGNGNSSDQMYVEGGSPPEGGGDGKVKLNDTEKEMCRKMNCSEESYLKVKTNRLKGAQ